MKTHTIKTPKAELLIVETPLNATNIIFNEGNNSLTWETENHIIKGYDLEGYTLLGKRDEISEEDVRGLVDSKEAILSTIYRNYNGGTAFGSRLESFFSLLESEIYWENPLGKEKPNFDPFLNYGQNEYWVELKNKWNEAEQKTFDRNRSVIFKKKI